MQVTSHKTVFFIIVAVKTSRKQLPAFAGFLLTLYFDPKDRSSTFLRNNFEFLSDLIALIQNGITH